MTTETNDQSVASDAPAVLVRGLSHTYKPARPSRSSRKHTPPPQDAALSAIDLEVRPGEVFALLGPNGSGKSTLLRILATVQAARQTTGTPGHAALFGDDITAHPAKARQHLGVVFQHPALDIKLTASENMHLHGKLYGLSGKALEDAADQALEALGMAERKDEFVEAFSGGMRRRVEIAKALLTRPRLLMMDEASAGLDIAIQREIWADLRKRVVETGLTVLLTTHLMDEAEQADRVAVMSGGKVVAVDTPDALVARVGGQVLAITPATGTDPEALLTQAADHLAGKIDRDRLTVHAGRVHLEHPDAPSVVQPLAEALGDLATDFRLGRPTLADAYLKLTGQTLSE